MHAIRQYAFGGADELRYEELPDPHPGPGQVRIAVRSAGVHLLDVTIRRGQAPPRIAPDLPMRPGSEVAGVVDEVGSGVDPSYLSRRVVADLGPASGGYAELALASASSLHLLPDPVGFDAAIATIGTGRTMMAILELARPSASDIVAITGAAGGVGTMLVRAAQAAGATVVGLASGARKAEVVAGLGATAVDCSEPDWTRRVRDAVPGGFTLALDGVGGAIGTELLNTLAVGARMVMFGTASGRAIDLTAEDIFARGISVTAAAGARLLRRPGGLRPLEQRALDALNRGELIPLVGQTFPLADAANAQSTVEARTSVGKTVLHPCE
jgi:NADPH2:quinone reductase